MKNPYLIEPPAVVSFSGGRSSGFMLWNILQAYDHKLPDDIKVVFCNTGLEHHETYEFIHRIEQNWTPVVWLEYCLDDEEKHSFQVVDYESASWRGTPFETVIKKKKYLPNPVTRICTANLKIRTMVRYIKSLGFKHFDNCVGLRADEPRRATRIKGTDSRAVVPMYEAGHSNSDVQSFWKNHPLDLRLPLDSNIFGNCVGCFLKGYGKLEAIAREEPQQMDWWIRMESETAATFRIDRPDYATIKRDAHKQLAFNFGDTIDCYCTD
jgi:hypothetical protein